MMPRSAQCESPAVDDQGKRYAAEGPLNAGCRWTVCEKRNGEPECAADQKTKEVCPEVGAGIPGSQHGEKGKTGGNGYPGPAPAHSLEAPPNDTKTAQHAHGTENRSGGTYRDVEGAVQKSIQEIPAGACEQDKSVPKPRTQCAAHGA